MTIPATVIGGVRYPAQHLPGSNLPTVTIPATTIPGGCFDVPKAFAISNTTVHNSDYADVDPGYSRTLTERYWQSDPAVSTPDTSAPGFGETNAAGFPKNEYVRPYVRQDGTYASGYWRNSSSDGLPTCHVVSC